MTKPGTKTFNLVDLSTLDTAVACDNGAQIELLHPSNKTGLGQFVGIVGKDSKIFRDNIAAITDKARRDAFAATKRGRDAEITTTKKSEAENIQLLVNCTTGFWHWTDEEQTTKAPGLLFGGEMIEYTPDNASALYTKMIFIRDQVNEGIGNLENFLPG